MTQAHALPRRGMVNDPAQKTLQEATLEAANTAPASESPTSPLGGVVERNLHVRAIRQLAHQTLVPPADRIVCTTRPKTIVVVDDEPDLVDLMVMVLEAAGHTAHGATRGDAALTLAVEHVPDLLLIDYMMPNMSGGELGKALRSLPELRQAAIVVISGTPEDTVRSEFDQFDLFLQKPVHPDRLLRIVEDL